MLLQHIRENVLLQGTADGGFLFLEWTPGIAPTRVASTPSSGQSHFWTYQLHCILHPPEDCVSTFIVLDAIHICGERTKTTQNLSPHKDT